MKRAFTLIEVLIAVMIVGLLTTILFRTYKTMIDISLRVENEKAVQQELLYFTQAMQSLSDRYTVDYTQYTTSDLLTSQGMTNELHLIDEAGNVATIKAEGDCYTQAIETEEHIIALRDNDNICQLVISEEGNESTALPSPKLVRLSHVQFKITPYASNQALLYSGVVQDQDELYTLLQYP
jgi:prepilin-type N-terminal cleavage/methylation domain-containing protein